MILRVSIEKCLARLNNLSKRFLSLMLQWDVQTLFFILFSQVGHLLISPKIVCSNESRAEESSLAWHLASSPEGSSAFGIRSWLTFFLLEKILLLVSLQFDVIEMSGVKYKCHAQYGYMAPRLG
jgi:hypothetical protein